jgi:glycosyltransferase involved in cell wall biosynthesis
MNSEQLGGIGEISPPKLPQFISQYRFFFNPIRYTSLGLAVCEAMMVGLPIVAFATTEIATTIRNGENGYIDTDIRRLIEYMRTLLSDSTLAGRLSRGARQTAQQRFSIERFIHDWDMVFRSVCRSNN